jgi:hypothetical protein
MTKVLYMERRTIQRHELEDYEPGITREEAHAALLKVARSPNPNPKRDRPKKPSLQPAEESS